MEIQKMGREETEKKKRKRKRERVTLAIVIHQSFWCILTAKNKMACSVKRFWFILTFLERQKTMYFSFSG